MKRICVLIFFLFVLSGCGGSSSSTDKMVQLRQSLLNGNGCEFKATITADYGDRTHTFDMDCTIDANGNLTFEVVAPETIAGITGVITEQEGQLTFDDQILLFEKLADNRLSPVTAPWLFVRALRSGYIKGCVDAEELLFVQIDDSYAGNSMQLDIWLSDTVIPERAEIVWDGYRVLSIEVDDFKIV